MEEEEPPSYELELTNSVPSYKPFVYHPRKTSLKKVEEDEDGFIVTWDVGV